MFPQLARRVLHLAFAVALVLAAAAWADTGEIFTPMVDNPVPTLKSISPSRADQGAPAAFTLTATGSGFLSGAQVLWNGSPRVTTYDNATQVRAVIPAVDLVVAGPKAVTVQNPAPTAGPSNTLTFLVRAPQAGKDLNNDGQSDLLWESTEGWVAAWLMSGTAQQQNLLLYNYPVAVDGWHIAGTGDFNADGQTDILWQSEAGYVAAWMMSGTTQMFSQLLYDLPVAVGGWRVAAAGDLDDDGVWDILWQDDRGYVAYWRMGVTADGLAYQRSNALLHPDPVAAGGWTIVGTGDLNGDKMTDLVWQSPEGFVAAWIMNGTTLVSSVLLYPNPVALDGWTVVGTADMNGDRTLDILWQDRRTSPGDPTYGGIAAWIMNGTVHVNTVPLSPSPVMDPAWKIVGPR